MLFAFLNRMLLEPNNPNQQHSNINFILRHPVCFKHYSQVCRVIVKKRHICPYISVLCLCFAQEQEVCKTCNGWSLSIYISSIDVHFDFFLLLYGMPFTSNWFEGLIFSEFLHFFPHLFPVSALPSSHYSSKPVLLCVTSDRVPVTIKSIKGL